MFSTVSKNSDYINIDEDEVIQFFNGLGIPKENIQIEFDTHDKGYSPNAGMMFVLLGIPLTDELEEQLNSELNDKWGDDDDVYDYDVTTTYDDNLAVVNVYFNDPIYNPNEEAWR